MIMLRFGETKETKKKVLCRKNPIKMACYMVILLLNIYISFLYIISTNLSLVYRNKYYLQVYLDNCAYKIANKRMAVVPICFLSID